MSSKHYKIKLQLSNSEMKDINLLKSCFKIKKKKNWNIKISGTVFMKSEKEKNSSEWELQLASMKKQQTVNKI